jgi:hypothetical protein
LRNGIPLPSLIVCPDLPPPPAAGVRTKGWEIRLRPQ